MVVQNNYSEEMQNSDKEIVSECCFVCGEAGASWVIHSKPNQNNKPFFPFLHYQKTPANAKGLDSNGACLSCNVCYLFLMQQWRSYEYSGTPILKRLYWLKRPANEYTDNDDTTKSKDNTCSVLETNNKFLTSSNGYIYQQQPNFKSEHFPVSDKHTDQKGHTEEIQSCCLCFTKHLTSKLKRVFSLPQQTPGIPFYSGLVKDPSLLDGDGRMTICLECYVELHKQWHDFEHKGTPLVERNYTIKKSNNTKEKSATVACYLCNDILSQDRRQLLYCKQHGEEPYYPFLKNLPVSYNAVDIDYKGFTYICKECKLFLRKQWDVFHNAGVTQEERVYRIHHSQPPLLPTIINQECSVACFICSEKSKVSALKRIYCNTGSNMNLGFLKSFSKNKEGFFSEDTGETFVCHSCFEELKQHWIRYRVSLFGLEEDCRSNDAERKSCTICKSYEPEESFIELCYDPEDSSDNEKPFFPVLAKFQQNDSKKVLLGCMLCSNNLMYQWNSYESRGDSDKFQRSYIIDKFTCNVCGGCVTREDIYLTDIDNLDKNDEIKAAVDTLKIEKKIAVCVNCKNKHLKVEYCEKKNQTSKETNHSKEPKDSNKSGMKATATVPPFLKFSMRNQDNSNLTPSSSEGSFAAALRKLAEQTPGFPSPVLPRDRRHSPPSKNGDIMSPMLAPHHSIHSSNRISGTPSIMVPHLHPPHPDKQDSLLKSPYRHLHSSEYGKERDSLIHHDRGHIIPGIFQYQDRDEHLHRAQKEHYKIHSRDQFDVSQHSANGSSASVILKNSLLKERPTSSIGLVHPQPARKHQEEDNMKTSVMNPTHYNHRELQLHPSSPPDMQRYATFVTPRQQPHTHSSQTSCPVHGHENTHPHEDRVNRPPGLPFDPAHLPRDFPLHGHHPRLREELQLQHGRHVLERKESLPSHHALEEDLRRRGLDYRWAGLPPHLLDESYRRHLIGQEHSPAFKEPPHGVYLPHFFYGRDYPIPADQYLPHGLPGQAELLHRHMPPISPRLLEYYRRTEHGVFDRVREYEIERRYDEQREKERAQRTASVDSLKRRSEESNYVERKKPSNNHVMEKNYNDTTNNDAKVPFFKGLNYKKTPKPYENAQQANSIDSLLNSKLPDAKTELAAASILANMTHTIYTNRSPCSEEIESVASSTGGETQTFKQKPIYKTEEKTHEEEMEQSEEKMNYMLSLGLVSHTRKRVLEDDFDRKRWDRKFRKFRGRPKKRSKRENTEESSVNGDSRSVSELDFYSGPMTRHKQQLLQEQESLLEQIQKRNSTDTNEGSVASEPTNNNEEKNECKPKTRRSPRPSPSKTSPKPFEQSTETVIKHSEPPPLSIKEKYVGSEPARSFSPVITSSSYNNHHAPTHETAPGQFEQSRLVAMLRDGPHHYQHHKQNKHNIHYDRHIPLHQHSPARDRMENLKVLDNSLFGRVVENSPEVYMRWPGVQPMVHAYSAYQAEYEAKRRHLLQSIDGLQREGRSLHQEKEHLEKDMAVYNERRMRIAEKRRHMHVAMEGIHQTLRTMSNI